MGDSLKTPEPDDIETGQREHIESILREYQHPEARRATRNLRNAIQIIGEKLNRQDIHFVAELVQNAEDAGRRSGQERTRLIFTVETDRIVVQNDGKPFDREDVESICDTAASSKRHAENQVGFMGIGFKSVFKITDQPQIHSAGYHFAITDYLFPHWIDDKIEFPCEGMRSAFVLPLKPDVDHQRLVMDFDRIDPTLLLFLKKLKSIEIVNRVSERVHLVEARTSEDGLVTLDSLDTKETWRLVSFLIPDTIYQYLPNGRPKRESGELQLALKVDDKGFFKRHPAGRFYAFLPTEQETGLGFHLQADFVPTASRENIEDNLWNRELLRYAAACLVSYTCALRDQGKHQADLYELLPAEREAKDEMARVVATAAKELASKEDLILTRSGQWVLPHRAKRLEKSEYRGLLTLLTKDDLSQYFGIVTDFVHESIKGRATDLIGSLGVAESGLNDLCQMLKNREWLKQKPLVWIIDLLAFLYDHREDLRKSGLVELVKDLWIIPLEGGLRTTAKYDKFFEQTFFPMPGETQESYRLFQGCFNLVAQELVCDDDNGARDKAREFLKWMGIRPFEPYPIIRDVVFPLFDERYFEQVEQQRRFRFLDFVRRNWHKYREAARLDPQGEQAAINKAVSTLKFQSRADPDRWKLARELLLPNAYRPDSDLETELGNLPGFDFITEDHALEENKAREAQSFFGPSWREFLRDLGALSRLEVAKVIDEFVLPKFKDRSWDESSWFPLTDFIRRHCEEYEQAKRAGGMVGMLVSSDPLVEIKQKLLLASSGSDGDHTRFELPRNLYISRTYQEDSDLHTAFGDVLASSFVCDDYLKYSTEGKSDDERKALRRSWRDFFENIGVQNRLSLLPRHEIGEQEYPGCDITWEPDEKVYGTISDMWSQEIAGLVESLGSAKEDRREQARARALLRMLDRHWSEEYERATIAQYHWTPQRTRQALQKMIPSAFSEVLKDNAWIPTQGNFLVKPEMALFSPSLAKEIGNPDRICSEEIRSEGLRKFLNVRHKLTVDEVLMLLREAKAEKADANVERVRKLYLWLQDHWDTEDLTTDQKQSIRRKFAQEPLVFVADGKAEWLTSGRCFWNPAPSSTIAKYLPALAKIYDGLRKFFVLSVGVLDDPSPADCLDALVEFISSRPLNSEEFSDVFRLYMDLEKRLLAGDEDSVNVLGRHTNNPMWLCEDGTLRKASEFYINDHPGLKQLFESAVQCLWWPDGLSPSALAGLLPRCGIARLSDAEIELEFGQDEISAKGVGDWHETVRDLSEALVRYLYSEKFAMFGQLQANGTIEALCHMIPLEREGMIPVRYRLVHGEQRQHEQKAYISLNERRLYVSKGLRRDDVALSKEVCRVIKGDPEIQNFIDSLLPRLGSDAVIRFLEERNIRSLRSDIALELGLARAGHDSKEDTDKMVPQERGPETGITETESPRTEPEPKGAGAPNQSRDGKPIPSFTGKKHPDVPVRQIDWCQLKAKFGDAVLTDLDLLGNVLDTDSFGARKDPLNRHSTIERIILSFMNRTQGFLPLFEDFELTLVDQGRPTCLRCQLNDKSEFDLYVDYGRRILYNQDKLPPLFEAHNIPAGGIVYLEWVHSQTVRFYWEPCASAVRKIRCAQLEEDDTLSYFMIDSAEYPCEVSELVVRAEKRLEDPDALFAEAIGKKSVFETMLQVFEAFGPRLRLEEIFNMVSTLRMVAYWTIRHELQRRPCFLDQGEGWWELERGLILASRSNASNEDDQPKVSRKGATIPSQMTGSTASSPTRNGGSESADIRQVGGTPAEVHDKAPVVNLRNKVQELIRELQQATDGIVSDQVLRSELARELRDFANWLEPEF